MATEKPDWSCTHEFDGGEKGCGELLLDLRLFFDPLEPNARVCVIAHDPGAWIDLPAWCRVTGHRLLDKIHPFYLIEKKLV